MTKWNGKNSVEIRHEQMERIRERLDEIPGKECEACSEHYVEVKKVCRQTGDNNKSSCFYSNGKICVFKISRNCKGPKIIEKCSRCGHIQGDE